MARIPSLHVMESEVIDMGQDDIRTLRQQMDRILYLLEGEEDVPGVVKRVANLEELLMGKQGHDGMAHQVRTMWKLHMWVLCSFSAIFGSGMTLLISKIIKYL